MRLATRVAWLGGAVLVLGGLLPPLHLHVTPDHDHADHNPVTVIHRHFSGHQTPSTAAPLAHHGAALADGEGLELDLDQQAIASHGTRVAGPRLSMAIPVVSPPRASAAGSVWLSQFDASPPHGPPGRPASLRAPPFLSV